MLGASIAATADSSTSHIGEILRFTDSGISRSERHHHGIGLDADLPQRRHRVLEWAWSSARRWARCKARGDMQEEDVLPADVVSHLPCRLGERQ